MKKRLFFFFIFTFAFVFSKAQNVYYDAIYFKERLTVIDDQAVIAANIKLYKERDIKIKLRSKLQSWIDEDSERTNNLDSIKLISAYGKEIDELNRRYKPSGDTLFTKLDYYFHITDDPSGAKLRFENNPFIQNLGLKYPDGEWKANGLDFVSTLTNPVGGLDVTAIADGLARFMVKRAKQELSMAFFTKFKEEMEKEQYSDLRILFPSTYKTLKVIDTEVYQYSAYLTTLREAFEKDLAQLPRNLPLVWKQEKYRTFFKKYPEIEYALDNVALISNGLLDNTHPGDILNNVAKNKYNGTEVPVKNFNSAIKVLDLFSQSVRDTAAGSYWISPKQGSLLLKNDRAFRNLFFALVYQESHNHDIKFYVKNNPDLKFAEDILGKIAKEDTNIQVYIDYINEFILKIEPIDNKIKEIKEKRIKGEKLPYEDYYVVVDKSLDLYEHAFKATELPYIKNQVADKEWPRYCKAMVPMGKLANETALDISNKNYSSAILNAGFLVDSIIHIMNSNIRVDIVEDLQVKLDSVQQSKIAIEQVTGDKKPNIALREKVNKFNRIIDKYALFKEELGTYKISLKNQIASTEDFNALNKNLDALLDSKELINALKNYVPISDTSIYIKLVKYGTFAASLATAKDAKQAEEIIETMALPAGSSRIKKQMLFSVSLNSYLGASYGTNDIFKSRKGQSYGVSGLLGVGLNWGIGRKNPSSFSLYANIIDIGALATFRLKNDQDYKFKIKLAQILSPGAFVVYGLPRVPLSLMVGYQYAPLIRTIPSTDAFIEYDANYNRGRLTVGIVVDMPLMHFYNQPKKFK